MKNKITEIFSDFGLPVYFAEYSAVVFAEKRTESYKTVLLTYLPYYYKPQNGNLSLYAALPDYHNELRRLLTPIKEKLEAEITGSFDIFVDCSPIDEKKAAALSGLGFIGDNSLIITDKYGSFVFLGEIITDNEIKCEKNPPSYCEHCGRCASACPTIAIENGKINAEKCLSALTQKKGGLTAEEEENIRKNGLAWGCDTCQLVCPHNRFLKTSDFAIRSEIMPTVSYYDIDGMSNSEFKKKYSDRAFTWRGVKTLKRNIEIIENGKGKSYEHNREQGRDK